MNSSLHTGLSLAPIRCRPGHPRPTRARTHKAALTQCMGAFLGKGAFDSSRF